MDVKKNEEEKDTDEKGLKWNGMEKGWGRKMMQKW